MTTVRGFRLLARVAFALLAALDRRVVRCRWYALCQAVEGCWDAAGRPPSGPPAWNEDDDDSQGST